MGSLFTPEPEQWGLRGDSHLWRALREALEETSIPATDEAVASLLVDRIKDLTDVDIRLERQEAVYREEFAHGGMSSGQIHIPTWRDRLIPQLIDGARRNSPGALIEFPHPGRVSL